MLVASLILHKIKEVEANSKSEGTNYECRTLAYIGIILTVLSLIIFTFLHYRKEVYAEDINFQMLYK